MALRSGGERGEENKRDHHDGGLEPCIKLQRMGRVQSLRVSCGRGRLITGRNAGCLKDNQENDRNND